MSVSDTESSKPWYRHFWVWFMLTPLIATVLASFYTLYLAGSAPPMVVDDFGRIAMTVEADHRRDARAAELGLSAELRMDDTGFSVQLIGAQPHRLKLAFMHPTNDRLDQQLLLEHRGDRYTGPRPTLDSRFYVQLSDEAGEWRMTGSLPRGGLQLQLQAGTRP